MKVKRGLITAITTINDSLLFVAAENSGPFVKYTISKSASGINASLDDFCLQNNNRLYM